MISADMELADKATYQNIDNQLLLEVTNLRQQVMEFKHKFAEIDRWKQQTDSIVYDLCNQLRAILHKTDEAPLVPSQALVLKQSASDVAGPLIKVRTMLPLENVSSPPSKDITLRSWTFMPEPAFQEFDTETSLKVYRSLMCLDMGSDGSRVKSESMRTDWNIKNFSTKLRGAMGRPLVSRPFKLWGLDEVHLIVKPELQGSDTGPRTRKEKEQFSKMVSHGPLKASLILKVPNAPPCPLKYLLRVGDKVTGPHVYNFSNRATDNHGSFDINWLVELDKDSSITVGVEMLPPDLNELGEEMLIEETDDELVSLPDDEPPVPPGLTLPLNAQ